MPTPRAAEYFGFSRGRPMRGYSRSYDPGYEVPNQYAMALGGRGPLDELKQEIADQGEAELLQSQMSGADAIPAIQKLVSSGRITPQQGVYMSRVQQPRLGTGSIPARISEGMRQLSMINPSDEDARQKAMEFYQSNPEMFTHAQGVAAINRLNQAIDKASASQRLSRTEQARLQMALGSALQRPTDEQKIEAAMKADKSLVRPTEKKPWEHEPWAMGWHKFMDPRIQALRQTVLGLVSSGRPVDPALAQWASMDTGEPPTPEMLGLQGGTPAAPAAMPATQQPVQQAAGPTQSTESAPGQGQFPVVNSVSELKAMNLPKGSYFKTPDGQVRVVK